MLNEVYVNTRTKRISTYPFMQRNICKPHTHTHTHAYMPKKKRKKSPQNHVQDNKNSTTIEFPKTERNHFMNPYLTRKKNAQ